MRQYIRDPEFFAPEHLAHISQQDFDRWFSDDIGPILLPFMETRYLMTRAYGEALTSSIMTQTQGWWNMERALIVMNHSGKPLGEFLNFTRKLPGYNEDPLLKKNALLAMILAARPERFLHQRESERWPPIIDYHLMRLALRTGMIEVEGEDRQPIIERHVISTDLEKDIREKVFVAMLELIDKSKQPIGFIDNVFRNARKYCPEMGKPVCAQCIFDDICAHRTDLFQPVFKTTNY